MPNISRGKLAVQWFATRAERVRPEPAPKPKREPTREKFQPWTTEEDALIYKSYLASGPVPIARKIGRTTKAVQNRASNLGVTAGVPKCLRFGGR